MIGQNNHETQFENRTITIEGKTTFNDTNNPTQFNGPLMDMYTLEKNIVDKVRSEMDCVMTTSETRVQDTVLSAIEDSVTPKAELRMKSVNASSGLDADSVVPDADQRDFSGDIEGFQLTASS